MRCCSCKYRPMLDGWDSDECYTDVCELVWEEDEISEYLYHGRYEIGCKFNQQTLDKRKKYVDEQNKKQIEAWKNGKNTYYG